MRLGLLVVALFFVSPIYSQKIRIKQFSPIAKFAGWVMGSDVYATTIGNTIRITCSEDEFLSDTDWVKHEIQHTRQCRRLGIQEFLKRYFFYWVIKGYWNNPLEVEARKID